MSEDTLLEYWGEIRGTANFVRFRLAMLALPGNR